MGIILLPIFIAIFCAVYKCVKIGWKGINNETEDLKLNYLTIVGLASIICAIPILGYLLYMSGKEIYSFELLIYIHVIPLLILIVVANVIPKSTETSRLVRNLTYLSTVFLFPLVFLIYEHALPWFNISTII